MGRGKESVNKCKANTMNRLLSGDSLRLDSMLAVLCKGSCLCSARVHHPSPGMVVSELPLVREGDSRTE